MSFMITFNLLSLPSFQRFLEDILSLREKFNRDDANNRIPLMINNLHWPPFLDMRLLPAETKKNYAHQYTDFIRTHLENRVTGQPGRFSGA